MFGPARATRTPDASRPASAASTPEVVRQAAREGAARRNQAHRPSSTPTQRMQALQDCFAGWVRSAEQAPLTQRFVRNLSMEPAASRWQDAFGPRFSARAERATAQNGPQPSLRALVLHLDRLYVEKTDVALCALLGATGSILGLGGVLAAVVGVAVSIAALFLSVALGRRQGFADLQPTLTITQTLLTTTAAILAAPMALGLVQGAALTGALGCLVGSASYVLAQKNMVLRNLEARA